METLGIHLNYFVIQILVCGIYPGLAVWALFSLRRANETDTSKVLWVMLILVLPIFGALAFFVIEKSPKSKTPT
jgi:hypothetical protein